MWNNAWIELNITESKIPYVIKSPLLWTWRLKRDNVFEEILCQLKTFTISSWDDLWSSGTRCSVLTTVPSPSCCSSPEVAEALAVVLAPLTLPTKNHHRWLFVVIPLKRIDVLYKQYLKMQYRCPYYVNRKHCDFLAKNLPWFMLLIYLCLWRAFNNWTAIFLILWLS